MNHVLRPVIRTAARSGVRTYNVPATHKESTMDDMPQPQGSWEASYNAQQKKYNFQLFAGVVALGLTFGFMQVTGFVDLNSSPPVPKN